MAVQVNDEVFLTSQTQAVIPVSWHRSGRNTGLEGKSEELKDFDISIVPAKVDKNAR